MSEIITGAVKFAFNFIRSYSAEQLQDGGLTDQKLRGWIVRELDDINSKLDGLSHKDLFASISCLKQGFERLIMSFEQTTETADPSTSELPKNEKQSEDTTNLGASTSTQTKPVKTSEVNDAVALANAIAKLKIVSNKRFESAMESFKEAGKEARRAFHNTALNTEERVLASKVRIASGILEHLDDPEFAARDCLQYLQELHDLPAIQDIFSVHIKAGIKSRIKSGFKKDSRNEIVETVTMINLILADFISTFTKRRMAVFDWPTIKCGKRVVHPIHYNKDSLPNLEEMKITPPWDLVKTDVNKYKCAFNKKGDLVFASHDGRGLQKLDKTTGKVQRYCLSPSQYKHIKNIRCLAVDEDDTVYVLSGDETDSYTLSIYSENGTNTDNCTLEFVKRVRILRIRMTVTTDKNIVICFKHEYDEDFKVCLCDRDGELRNSFVAGQIKDHYFIYGVFVSCNNEIIIVTSKDGLLKDLDMLHIYTEDGRLQRTVTLRSSDSNRFGSICYNAVSHNIIGRIWFVDRILVEFLSDQTGELLYSYLLHEIELPYGSYYPNLVCHKNGTLALVDEQYVLFLQKPSI